MKPFVKLKKKAQSRSCCGWHKHVNKWEKRIGNKYIRAWLRKDMAHE